MEKISKNNTISIVTPSYNQGGFIEQTILSVLGQEGDFFIDYIIADGGSTDQSVEIIKKYSNLINSGAYKIKCKGINMSWWSKKDNGQSEAINMGFSKAKGSIIAWINSDDYYEKNTFKVVIDFFKNNHEVSLLYGGGRIVDEFGNEIKVLPSIQVDHSILLRRGCYVFQPSAFFTKEVFDSVGRLDENMHYSMDYDLWIRISRKNKIKNISNIFSNFREWGGSKTVSKNERFLAEERKIFRKYGGNIIDIRLIQKYRGRMMILDYLKKKFPNKYEYGKKIFYWIVDHFRYLKIGK